MHAFRDKWIVITGGAGFIGSNLLRHLNDAGYRNIILVDDLGHGGKWKNLVGKSFIDIIPINTLFDWLDGMESEIGAIFHLGACAATTETNADYLLENNFRYSCRLAEYALGNGHRFIYASSAATYGDGSQGFSDDEEKLEALEPLNMYGYSKHLFDLWLKNCKLLDQVVGLKYFNVFGPNENHKEKMASAVVKMARDANSTGVIRLFQSSEPDKYKDGEQIRDFIYVKDAVRMTAQFLANSATGIFNIGSGMAQTWNALAHAVGIALEKDVRIEYIPMPEELRGKYQNHTTADMAKYRASDLLSRDFLFEEAVGDYVRNFLVPGKYW